jgi:hypothetical protein
MISVRAATVVFVAGCGLIPLAGCGPSAKPRTPRVVTVTVPGSSAAAGGAPASSSTPAPSPPTKVRTVRQLPGSCDSLLPVGSIIDALGRPVHGATAFVVGQPDPDVGKLGYINCRYGLPSTTSTTPGIEIGVNLYRSPANALARIRPTVDDYLAHGARQRRITVAGVPANELTGGSGPGYGPTVVLAADQRTIAVSFRPGQVAASRVARDLGALAALALRRTAPG